MKKIIYTSIILIVGYFFVTSIYDELHKDKTPGKAKRLACQKKVTTFERAFDDLEVSLAQKEIESHKIVFHSDAEKATYMKSQLFQHISLKQTNKVFREMIDKYRVNNKKIDKNFIYSYYIYENDKKDPGKKSKKSKLYAGYVVFEVKNENNKMIYKIQIDFLDNKGADIDQTIRCAIKSFMTYNK